MDEVFEPPHRLGLTFTLSLAFLALVGALVLLIVGSGSITRDINLLLLALAVPLLLVFFFFSYRAFLISTTSYLLNDSSLELNWGFRCEVIPLDAIDWAHRISDFETPMPLTGFLLPGQYYGTRQIRGLGQVVFASTDKLRMVLIRTGERHFVISPSDVAAFSETMDRLLEAGNHQLVEPVSKNLRSMLRDVFQEKSAKKLLMVGFIAVLLLAVVAVVLGATRTEVTWITLERVSTSRLLLLVLVGAFIWLLNALVGTYFFVRGLLIKRWVYLIWAWSILVCLILTLAAVFMSLG